jgi:raffinose/stachyose/melibiose transport system substrate-binding protein
MLGGLDKWMPPFVYEQVQSQFEDKDFTRKWVFNTTTDSFVRPGNIEAAKIFQGWATSGYFNDGFLGLPAEEAQKQFAGGKGLFFAQATGWAQPFQQQTKPGEIGFFVLPPRGGGLVTTGNLAVAYSIPSRAPHPEAAAAYLDYLISEESLANAAANGLLPAGSFSSSAQTSPLFNEVLAAWTKVQAADGFVPYLLNRSETMFTTLTERTQELLAGRITPEEFVDAIDADAKGP